MAAAFALGAEGVQMGTRMVSSAESPVHANWKNAILAAKETDTVFLNRFGPGPALRALRTEKTTAFEKEPPANIMGEFGHAKDLYFGGDMEASIALSGQVAGRIDAVKPVAQVIAETVANEFEDGGAPSFGPRRFPARRRWLPPWGSKRWRGLPRQRRTIDGGHHDAASMQAPARPAEGRQPARRRARRPRSGSSGSTAASGCWSIIRKEIVEALNEDFGSPLARGHRRSPTSPLDRAAEARQGQPASAWMKPEKRKHLARRCSASSAPRPRCASSPRAWWA